MPLVLDGHVCVKVIPNVVETQRSRKKLAAIAPRADTVGRITQKGNRIMSLNDLLEKMREASWGAWPTKRRAIVERANRDLQESGILDQIVKVGEKAPDFTVIGSNGTEVSLSGLLESGPLVLSFYRGHW